jgi:hypothetical protein
MAITDEGIRGLNQGEHNEDAHAKRVVLRYQNPDDGLWYNFAPPMTPGVEYDYLDVQQTDADTETYIFKLGGAGGTTVRTIVVNYTDSTKENIDNVSWS